MRKRLGSARLCLALAWTAAGCGVPAASPVPVPEPPPAVSAAAAPAPVPAPPPAPPPEPARPPVRVLYVEGNPRWEFQYLSNLLVRDATVQTWTWLIDGDPDTPDRTSPGLAAFDRRTVAATREWLAAFDVVILGDVEPASLLPGADGATRALSALREFVAQGGGLVVLAGRRAVPSKLAGTPLEEVLPVTLDHALEVADPLRPVGDAGFEFRVTPDGERSPLLDVAGDPSKSKSLWETSTHWRQFWTCPVSATRPGASVLMEASTTVGGNVKSRPVVVAGTFGRGRVLFVGVDELWRIRYDVGDRYFGPFWKGAVRSVRPAQR